jgi:hypothetical protein
MVDFPTHWVRSGLPDLAARAASTRWPVFNRATGDPVMTSCPACSEQYRPIG